ncbi:zymogen granule membrane protein 16-like [Brachyistius frenatus]|uniref:zymogen granule membrane protein 16-like n=1 Tax=Brachyistius frenatus TaxID=100188 RepID=UPI0037E734D7
MHYILAFALLTTAVLAGIPPQYYSFSPPVGSGSGQPYTITGEGRITAIRVWEANSNYIQGLQVCYNGIWSPTVGYAYNGAKELQLFDNEVIVQVSGKYSHYVQWLVFVTNRGRSLFAGQPSGLSFNMYPSHEQAELRFISGRLHGALTSIGAHWAVFTSNSTGDH